MTDGAEDGFLRVSMISAGSTKNIDMINGNINIADSAFVNFGAGSDLTITSDGTNGTIAAPNGTLTIDVAGDITFDVGGGDIILKDDGTEFGNIANSS